LYFSLIVSEISESQGALHFISWVSLITEVISTLPVSHSDIVILEHLHLEEQKVKT